MQKVSPEDIQFMKRALTLASKGKRVWPNPKVGAIFVKNNQVIGQGWHKIFGGPHAEINAAKNAKQSLNGSTCYVNLEPCAHWGKTSPCVDFLIREKIRKVVIGCIDPNPLVGGKGIDALKKAGIQVVLGVLENQSRALNQPFFNWIANKMPTVVVKVGQSLDGKIATKTGQSQWITSRASRDASHKLRHNVDAILVGVSTILKDNPRLTDRSANGVRRTRALKRVVLDTQLRTPLTANIFSGSASDVLLLVGNHLSSKKIDKYLSKAQVIKVPTKNNRVDFRVAMKLLGAMGIHRVLIEGGGEVVASALKAKLVREVYFFIAPKIIGGKDSVNAVGGYAIKSLSEAVALKKWKVQKIGPDILIHGWI